MKLPTPALLRIAFAGLGMLCSAFVAQAQTFFNEAQFLAALQPGYYTEGFHVPVGNGVYSNGTFSYQLSAGSNGLWYGVNGNAAIHSASTVSATAPLLATSLSGNINAIGGYLFNTDGPGAFIPGVIHVSINGDTPFNFSSQTYAGSFLGYIAPLGTTINTLSLTSDGVVGSTAYYPSMTNVTVGTAVTPVPEPSTYGLMGVGALAGIAFLRRRKAAKA